MSTIQAYYSSVSRMRPEIAGHLPSIEWLVSSNPGDRRTGRSYVLATAFLKAAHTSNGAPVKVFDHHLQSGGRLSQDMMISTLREIAPGVHVSGDGQIEAQPAFASNPSSVQSWKLAQSLRKEFMSLCSACMRHGVSAEWMMETVKAEIVDSVMRA